MEIIPSVLTDDPKEFGDYIEKLNDVILPHGFPLSRVQIDVNDGSFLGIKTIEPEEMSQRESKYKIDYHLMVENPTDWIDRCAKGKADRIIGQVEKIPDQIKFLEEIKNWNLGCGIAVDFPTDPHEIHPEILPKLDVILLMSYPAGVGGQEFNNQVFDKVRQLQTKREQMNYGFSICIDGGVTVENIKQIKLFGAEEVCVGERLIKGDIEQNFEEYVRALY